MFFDSNCNDVQLDDVHWNVWTNIYLLKKSFVIVLGFLKIIKLLAILFIINWLKVSKTWVFFKYCQNIEFHALFTQHILCLVFYFLGYVFVDEYAFPEFDDVMHTETRRRGLKW